MGVQMRPTCPRCFGELGHSIVMEFNNSVFHCPKDPTHKFTLDDNGFFVPYRP